MQRPDFKRFCGGQSMQRIHTVKAGGTSNPAQPPTQARSPSNSAAGVNKLQPTTARECVRYWTSIIEGWGEPFGIGIVECPTRSRISLTLSNNTRVFHPWSK